MLDTSQFTYRVVYLDAEQAFLATCDEFEHLCALAPSYEKAIEDIQKSVSQFKAE